MPASKFSLHTKKMIAVALLAIAVAVPTSTQAIAGLPGPFGGPIVKMTPCLTPPGWQITLGPPTFGSYIYVVGRSISFLFGPPWHPWQFLLGLSFGASSCIYNSDGDSISGDLILFHGASL